MTSIISIVTPVHPASAQYLNAAYDSLARQELPSGWDWEWLVQEDGESGSIAASLPDDVHIRPGTGRPGGPGVARNLALARAEGALVKVLDADDVLCANTLSRDIEILAGNPSIAWTTSRVLDLMPDGSTVGFESDPPEGTLTNNQVLTHWRKHNYRAPVHPATLCLRKELLLALGGWMALPASEDTGLLISASIVSDGYFIAEAGLHYRKWSGQSTSKSAHTAPGEYAARMQLIEARAEALLKYNWSA